MSLSSLLTKLTNVRGAIVSAICSKGVELVSSATLHECASAIQNISVGSGGADVSDTTATAATVLAGYDFYLATGSKTTGTIPTVTASQSGNVVTVPAGYIATAQTLTVGTTDYYKCATIIPSVNFDFAGGLDPADGLYTTNGRMLNGYPVYRKGTTNYYLSYVTNDSWIITDVDPEDDLTEHILFANNESPDITDWPEPMTVTYASSGFWTGYKAVFDAVSGTYSYEATATSGLTWNLIQPQVGKVYTADAMIRVELYTGLPLAGLDFYLPLTQHMNDTVHNYAADTSQDYDSEFTITSDSTGGFLRCSKQYGSSSCIYWPDTANQYAYGTDDFAISFWLRAPDWSTYYDGSQVILNKKSDDSTTGMAFHRGYHSDNLSLRVAYENDLATTANVTNSGWVHWCIVRENGVGYWYRNGVLNATGTMSGSFTSSEPFNIGYHGQPGWESNALFDLKALRIYNRALTAAEVATLAAEFTPSV